MKKERIAVVAAAAVLVLAGLAGWLAFSGGPAGPARITASGTVEATEADLGFQLPGRIESIVVREGERVARGAELAALDRAELLARRAAAEAQLAAARALLSEMERGARPQELAQARSAVTAAAQRHDDAQRDVARARNLFEGGAISREALDKAETAAEVARAQHEQALEQLALVEAGPRDERIAAQRALVRQAEAALAQLDVALENSVIRAPFDGVVTVRHREPGEIVAAGLPVVTLMDPADRWVRIYVREDEVGRLSPGQPATITADAYPDRRYTGRITYISGEAEFTPRNVQTPEERIKLVYAAKVAVTGDTAQELKPGLPADVRLEEPQ
jgi:HlyD family secretion protein